VAHADTLMQTLADRERLARQVMALALSLRVAEVSP
jgi:hypothetical protein